MGKRSAVVELFLGDMGSMQRELRPSTQREDQLTMETKLEQIAVKAVNQLPKSVVREIRTPRSVGAGGGRPPPATRWDGKRGDGHRPPSYAPILDSTTSEVGQLFRARRPALSIFEVVVIALWRYCNRTLQELRGVMAQLARSRALRRITGDLRLQFHEVDEDVGLAPQLVG